MTACGPSVGWWQGSDTSGIGCKPEVRGAQAPALQKPSAHMHGSGDDGCVGGLQVPRAKRVDGKSADKAVRRRQRPWLVHQIRKLNSPAPRPGILRACDHDDVVVE